MPILISRIIMVGVLCILFVLFQNISQAQQVVYVNGDQNGQGILRQSNGECYLISPEHVTGFAPEVSIIDARRQKIMAVVEASYPSDISVSKLSDKATCITQWPSSRWIKRKLSHIENAALVTRGPDGSLKRRFVLITETDDLWVKVRPKYDESLFQGLSGSALTSEGKLLGQLMSIDSQNNIGNVLRQDFIDNILKNRFGEGAIDYVGQIMDGNLLSSKWEQYGNNLGQGNIDIRNNVITLRYSGTGSGGVNIGVRQRIKLTETEGLKFSYNAKATALIWDNSYVGIALSLFDKGGQKVITYYSSPDRYMTMDKPATSLKWRRNDVVWDVGRMLKLKQFDVEATSTVEVALFVKTQNTHQCIGCKLSIKGIKLYYK